MEPWHIIYPIISSWHKRTSLLRAMLLAVLFAAVFSDQGIAQSHNASDWHVPPPLPPGSTAKGTGSTTTGTTAPITLSLTDIPAVALPAAQAVQLPGLAPVSVTAPSVTAPNQPAATVVIGIPEIPLPGAPDAPALPKQTIQDIQVNMTANLPFVAAPEVPPLPPEPQPSGQTAVVKPQAVPLLPYMAPAPSPAMPANTNMTIWATPSITENGSSQVVTGGK